MAKSSPFKDKDITLYTEALSLKTEERVFPVFVVIIKICKHGLYSFLSCQIHTDEDEEADIRIISVIRCVNNYNVTRSAETGEERK